GWALGRSGMAGCRRRGRIYSSDLFDGFGFGAGGCRPPTRTGSISFEQSSFCLDTAVGVVDARSTAHCFARMA
ncbi:MAG: hypothetical protein ACI90M_003992, partial [Candidatus Azotimanducaceae bacterium]